MKNFLRFLFFSLKLWWPYVTLWKIRKGYYDGRMPISIAAGTIALQAGMTYTAFYFMSGVHAKMWLLIFQAIVYFWGSWLQYAENRIQAASRTLEKQPSAWHLL